MLQVRLPRWLRSLLDSDSQRDSHCLRQIPMSDTLCCFSLPPAAVAVPVKRVKPAARVPLNEDGDITFHWDPTGAPCSTLGTFHCCWF